MRDPKPGDAALRPEAELGALAEPVARRLEALDAQRIPERIWQRDPTVWKDDPKTPEILDRLGWLTCLTPMAAQAADLASFAAEARQEFDRVVLCGMGGSSLAPEVLWRSFGRAPRHPSLVVLDSTDPRTVAAADAGGDLSRTLFLISSKSGGTLETESLYRHYWELCDENAAQFVAITDPVTSLAALASERGFRRKFLNPPDIGGRYSALSYFGLVPAALLGIDVARLLRQARRMAEACSGLVPSAQHPGAWLGAVLGEACLAGRDKVTFVLSPTVSSYGLWAEQLLAESTGKEGRGIVPVAEEPLGAPHVYGDDRLFVALELGPERDPERDRALHELAAAGHPVLRIGLETAYDLGGEFFRWEFATAVAGHVLGIHPFDQPNVAESKANTKAVLASHARPSPPASESALRELLRGVPPGDYLALLAYMQPGPENDARFRDIRVRLRAALTAATTLGYGPRYLHSTGQLHKGGPPRGHFVQITPPADRDIPILGEPFTFGELEAAQAEGDLQALRARGRPALRIERLELLEEVAKS